MTKFMPPKPNASFIIASTEAESPAIQGAIVKLNNHWLEWYDKEIKPLFERAYVISCGQERGIFISLSIKEETAEDILKDITDNFEHDAPLYAMAISRARAFLEKKK